MPTDSNDPTGTSTAPTESPAPPSVSSIVLRLAVFFFVPFCMNAWFWFGSDFSRFVPPSDGRFEERASLTVWSALGPLAFGLRRRDDGWGFADLGGDGGFSLLVAGVFVLVVASSIRLRRHAFWRALGYVAMLVWIGFGCARTSLRVT